MNYEQWISYKYLRGKKRGFLSFLTFISVAGIAIGVMALIVVTGVMTGFGNNLREKIIGTTPHLMVEKETGIKAYQDVLSQISQVSGVQGASPYVHGNAFLESEGQALGVIVRGILPESEPRVTKVKQYLEQGDLADLAGDSVIIGKELARFYGYTIGDTLTVISPSSGVTKSTWRHPVKIVGIFKTGMADYDMGLILVNLEKAQDMFSLEGGAVSGIGVKVQNPYLANDVKDEFYKILGYAFMVKSWIDVNRNLFEALFLEKWGLFIVLTLMVIVASFNIISTLIVTVMSKVHDIGILQALGVPKRSIRRIFSNQGFFIGLWGIFWGLMSGFGFSYLLKTYFKVPADIYSIDHVPVEIQAFDVICIIFAAMVITYLATIYPAIKASRLQPVEALRYE